MSYAILEVHICGVAEAKLPATAASADDVVCPTIDDILQGIGLHLPVTTQSSRLTIIHAPGPEAAEVRKLDHLKFLPAWKTKLCLIPRAPAQGTDTITIAMTMTPH